MGMFDYICLPVKCPYCGQTIYYGQTKDFSNLLFNYKSGDEVKTNKKEINAIYSCTSSLECIAAAIRRDKKIQGLFSGFGMIFDVKIKIKKGFISSEYSILNEYDKAFFRKGKIEEALELFKDRFRYYLLINLNENDLKKVIGEK